MAKLKKTHHARLRMQQRCITEIQERLLHYFGRNLYQTGGSSILEMDHKTLKDLRSAIDRLEGVQLVLGTNDQIVTAQHNHKKIRSTQYTT